MTNKTIIDQGTVRDGKVFFLFNFNVHEFFVYLLQIQRLCDHLQSASHIQDREETIRVLQTFSKVRKKKDFYFSNVSLKQHE
jgi:hypothetical protein